jgi:prolyl 4-hydroxylase
MKLINTLLLSFTFLASAHAETPMQTLSTSPRIYYFKNFLSANECDHIMKEATPHLERSTVLAEADEGKVDYRRTSYGMFFASNPQDKKLRALEERIAKLTNTPIENGEALQVLRYGVGGEFQPHHDFFVKTEAGGVGALNRGGQRVATMIIYLNTPEKGGETVFPIAKVSITPKKGDAVLFYNVTPTGEVDSKSLHGGSPVLGGEKWIITKWIREGVFH